MYNEELLNLLRPQKNKDGGNIEEKLRVIKRRKITLIVTIIVVALFSFIYNRYLTPVYESTVILKKEKESNKNMPDEFQDIVLSKSSDQIETELELITTRNVLDKVINKLNLYFVVDKYVNPAGKEVKLNKKLLDYNEEFQNEEYPNPNYPQFLNIEVKPVKKEFHFYIKKTSENNFELHNADDNSLIKTYKDPAAADIKLNYSKMVFYWPKGKIGSKIYFSIQNYYTVLNRFAADIKIDHTKETDVFSITVRAATPFSAQTIANTLSDEFRDTRINQQKQGIRYSFDFIDKQLQEISERLKQSESDLSEYKSGKKLLTIDASSKQMVDFLSSLEAEKVNTDLELNDFQNKVDQIKKEYKDKGFFDQTYLAPKSSDPSFSPFSTLLRQLSDLEIQRIDMMQKRKETHPDVIRMDEQIAEIKNKLASYNQNTISSYEIMISSLQQKKQNLSSLINKYENKIEGLPAQETQLAGLIRQKNVFEKVFNLLLNKREEMRMAELSKLQDIIVVDPAHLPAFAIYPGRINTILSLIIGLSLGLIIIFILEGVNKKIVNIEEVKDYLESPIFAIIPNYSKDIRKKIANSESFEHRFVTLMNTEEGFKESFRVLRAKLSIYFGNKRKIMMFTSCEENTGKTTILANLAISIAESNKKVLIIDADLKKSRLSHVFDVPKGTPGLIQYLTGDFEIPNIYNVLKFKESSRALKSLNILPSGGICENSSELLSGDKIDKLVAMLNSSSYDYIFIDTPPVTRIVDTLIMGRLIKDAILIIRPEHSYKDSVEWGVKEMAEANISIGGVVINACDIKKSSFKYRYGYGYGYEYGESENGNGKKKKIKIKSIYS